MKSLVILSFILLIVVFLCIYWQIHKRITSIYHSVVLSFEVNKKLYDIPFYTKKFIEANYKQKIPFQIFRTNEFNQVPSKMRDSINIWTNTNFEYDSYMFDDKECLQYIKNNYSERILNAYKKLIPGAYKSDFWRYCVLFREGGVYIDSPMICIEPLRKIINPKSDFLCVWDIHPSGEGIYNAFMASVPNHPILKYVIDICVDMIEREDYGVSDLDITGPRALWRAYMKFVNETKNNIQNIQILQHYKREVGYEGGFIANKNPNLDKNIFIWTKYIGYSKDKIWYNSKDSYSILWKNKNVFQ